MAWMSKDSNQHGWMSKGNEWVKVAVLSMGEVLLSVQSLYGATANNQQTINLKDKKMPSLGSRPMSIIAFQDLAYQCCHLVSSFGRV